MHKTLVWPRGLKKASCPVSTKVRSCPMQYAVTCTRHLDMLLAEIAVFVGIFTSYFSGPDKAIGRVRVCMCVSLQ